MAIKTESSIFLSLYFKGHFPGEPGLASCIGVTDDENGDNPICETCIAPVKSSPQTNQHPAFYRQDDIPVTQPTVSKQTSNMYLKYMDVFFILYLEYILITPSKEGIVCFIQPLSVC